MRSSTHHCTDCTVGLVSLCKGLLFFKWIEISAIVFPKIILIKQYNTATERTPHRSLDEKTAKISLSVILLISSKSLDLELFQRIPGWRRNFVVWSKQTNKVENHETEVCLFWFYCVSPLLIIYSSCLVVPLEGQFSIARWHGCLKVYPSPVLDCKTNRFWQSISVLVIYLDLLKCMV